MASAISVLSEYPLDVMKTVCDPRVGLPAKSKWLPTVFEIKEACEAAMAPVYRRQREEQIAAERRAALSAPPITRMTREEMVAKYGENWGLTEGDSSSTTEARAAQMSRANESLMLSEYTKAGIEPIEAAPGIPVSLTLARKLGRRALVTSK